MDPIEINALMARNYDNTYWYCRGPDHFPNQYADLKADEETGFICYEHLAGTLYLGNKREEVPPALVNHYKQISSVRRLAVHYTRRFPYYDPDLTLCTKKIYNSNPTRWAITPKEEEATDRVMKRVGSYWALKIPAPENNERLPTYVTATTREGGFKRPGSTTTSCVSLVDPSIKSNYDRSEPFDQIGYTHAVKMNLANLKCGRRDEEGSSYVTQYEPEGVSMRHKDPTDHSPP